MLIFYRILETVPTLPVDTPDSPALNVEWLVDIGGFHIGTRTYVTAGGVTYRARLLNAPQITRAMSEEWYGFSELSQLGLRIDNTDGAYDALWGSRGLPVLVTRFDREANVSVVEFEGVVDRPMLDAGDAARVRAVEIEAFNQDLRTLETKVPKRVTSTTLFGPTCPNPGKAIPKVVGNVPLVPLIYVRDDVPGILFDHLVGEGTSYTISEVRRDRLGDQMPELLAPSEYSVVTYSGLTVIRTGRRQLKGGGGFHQLYATVSGPSTERNFSTFAGVLMGDTTWGAGLTVDAASITAAAALVPAALVIDGVLAEAKPASEWLRTLLELRGGRPRFSATAGWGLTIDAPATTAKMILRDEPGPGVRTMLAHGRRSQPGLNDDVTILRVQYAPNLLTGEGYVYETSPRAVSPVGAEKVMTHDLLRDRTAADLWACYMAAMMRDPDVVEGAAVHEEGRRLFEGDVVQVISSPLLLLGVDRKILSIEKGSGRHTLRHRRYDSADYVYTAGTLPPLQTIDDTTTPPAAPTGLVLTTGTSLIDGRYVTWGAATWNRNTDDTSVYYVRHRQVGTVPWVSFSVPQPDTGATVTTKAETHLPTTMLFEAQVMAEDVWGNKSAWAPVTPVQITIAADALPITPTGLVVTSTIESAVAQDGSYLASVDITFNRNPESDILRYNIQGRAAGSSTWGSLGSIQQTASGSPTLRLRNIPAGVAGDVRVQAEDRDGHFSAFCAPVSITTATFGTGPAAPTGVAAVATSLGFRITFDRVAEVNIEYYEIHEGTSSGFAITGTGEVLDGTCIAHVGGASYLKNFSAVTAYPITRFYRVVAVRTSGGTGIRGTASASVSATAGGVKTGDIALKEVKQPNIDDRAVGALQRVTYTAVAGAYPSLAPGAAFADSVAHGMGQIPAITIDTSRLEILWHVYDITNSIFAFVLWNGQPAGGTTIPSDTAIAYYR